MLWLIAILVIAVHWDTNRRIQKVHDRLDKALEELGGLRRYLYEIDPQFDDERRANVGDYHADLKWRELVATKKESGRRTLDTGFSD